VRPLVGADAARAVLLHTHAREEAPTGQAAAVGTRVLLVDHPQRRLLVAHQAPLGLPALEQAGRVLVGVRLALGQVDMHDVVRGARRQLGALGRVDHVVGRGGDGAERAHDGEVGVQGAQRLDLGHGGRR
jgi:hypothetical protein